MLNGDGTYEDTRRVVYGAECATFVPVCEKCGRYVRADQSIKYNDYGLKDEPNATCTKCGRTKMLFEGFI